MFAYSVLSGLLFSIHIPNLAYYLQQEAAAVRLLAAATFLKNYMWFYGTVKTHLQCKYMYRKPRGMP